MKEGPEMIIEKGVVCHRKSVSASVCLCMWKPELAMKMSFSVTSFFVYETGSLSELGTCHFGKPGWPLILTNQSTRLRPTQACTVTSRLYVVTRALVLRSKPFTLVLGKVLYEH